MRPRAQKRHTTPATPLALAALAATLLVGPPVHASTATLQAVSTDQIGHVAGVIATDAPAVIVSLDDGGSALVVARDLVVPDESGSAPFSFETWGVRDGRLRVYACTGSELDSCDTERVMAEVAFTPSEVDPAVTWPEEQLVNEGAPLTIEVDDTGGGGVLLAEWGRFWPIERFGESTIYSPDAGTVGDGQVTIWRCRSEAPDALCKRTQSARAVAVQRHVSVTFDDLSGRTVLPDETPAPDLSARVRVVDPGSDYVLDWYAREIDTNETGLSSGAVGPLQRGTDGNLRVDLDLTGLPPGRYEILGRVRFVDPRGAMYYGSIDSEQFVEVIAPPPPPPPTPTTSPSPTATTSPTPTVGPSPTSGPSTTTGPTPTTPSPTVSAPVDPDQPTAPTGTVVVTERALYPHQDGYRDSTSITVGSLSEAAAVAVTVRDAAGDAVVERSSATAMTHTVLWDGQGLPEGAYDVEVRLTGVGGGVRTIDAGTVTVSLLKAQWRTSKVIAQPQRTKVAARIGRCSRLVSSPRRWAGAHGLYSNATCVSSSAARWVMTADYRVVLPKAVAYRTVTTAVYGAASSKSRRSTASMVPIDARGKEARGTVLGARAKTYAGPRLTPDSAGTLRWRLKVGKSHKYDVRTVTLTVQAMTLVR